MQNNIKIIEGNLFNSKSQTLVNTINTVGVMGAGIALEFRLRYPEMYRRYKELCKKKQIQIGKLWIYKATDRYILNFPTKEHWKDDSKIEYLEKGLEKFVNTYKEKGIISIAFPILGSDRGNMPPEISLNIMLKYLSKCDIPIEIYKYDPNIPDDLFPILKEKVLNISIDEFVKITNIKKKYAIIIFRAVIEQKVKSLSALKDFSGIGISTLEKLYDFLFDRNRTYSKDELTLKLLELAKTKLNKNAYITFENYLFNRKKISKSEYSILRRQLCKFS